MGLFSCFVPRKLLRPPLNADSRKLLLALASFNARLDPQTLAHEDANNLWVWAAETKDLFVLQCLMGVQFGFRPTRQQRLDALRRTDYDATVVRLFRETRTQDPKHGWKWYSDWPVDWPLGDAEAEAELSARHQIDFVELKEFIDSGSRLRDWKIGFGADIPENMNRPKEAD